MADSHNPICISVQTLNVVMPAGAAGGGTTAQTVPAKVLDCDTITQVKEKLLEQTWKGTSFSQRPHVDSLHLGTTTLVSHHPTRGQGIRRSRFITFACGLASALTCE